MGPLSFLNGAFLAAIATAALPVLIHLFSRRRAREVPFSSLGFLDEITRRKIRRIQLRQWILLALRTLAIALIALALCRPVWQGTGFGGGQGSSTVAILIDDSFSMEAALDPTSLLPLEAGASGIDIPTRFSEARQRALQLIDLLDEDDRAILVFTGDPVRIPYRSVVRDPSLLREELQRAQPRPTRSNLGAALDEVKQSFSSSTTLNREIFIISDFQDNQMSARLNELGASEQASDHNQAGGDTTGSRSLLNLPADTNTYLLPVISPVGPNLAVTRAFYERNPAGPGGRVMLRVTNHGEEAIESSVIQVFGGEDEQLLAEGFVSVAAGAVTQAEISIPIEPSGGQITVRGATDLLGRDNIRHLSTSAIDRFRVLIVTGGPVEDPVIRTEVAFAVLALDPWSGLDLLSGNTAALADINAWRQEQAAGLQLFAVETIPESDLGQGSPISADAVLLLNVGRLSATAAERLESYQANGGSIMIALGDRVDPRTYNTQILPRLGQVRLENVAGDLLSDTYFSLRPAITGHAIFNGFPIAPGEMLTSARFRRLLDVRLGADSRVLAEFSGDRPALVEEPGLLLFTSSLDVRWSDFPTSASFLPFLNRALLHQVLRGRIGQHDPLVGERLSEPLGDDAGDRQFRCLGPDGIEIPLIVAQTELGPVLRSDFLPEPGFYHFLAGTRNDLSAPEKTFAVNVDTEESDLTIVSEEKAALLFGEDALWLESEENLDRRILEARHGRELWKLCLVLALMLLVAESLIARGLRLSNEGTVS